MSKEEITKHKSETHEAAVDKFDTDTHASPCWKGSSTDRRVQNTKCQIRDFFIAKFIPSLRSGRALSVRYLE